MSAYVLFLREKTLDEEELKLYSAKVPAALEGHPLKLLVMFGLHEVIEGPELEGAALLEFPSFEEAKAWHDSPAYTEAAKHRLNGAITRVIIFDGVGE